MTSQYHLSESVRSSNDRKRKFFAGQTMYHPFIFFSHFVISPCVFTRFIYRTHHCKELERNHTVVFLVLLSIFNVLLETWILPNQMISSAFQLYCLLYTVYIAILYGSLEKFYVTKVILNLTILIMFLGKGTLKLRKTHGIFWNFS